MHSNEKLRWLAGAGLLAIGLILAARARAQSVCQGERVWDTRAENVCANRADVAGVTDRGTKVLIVNAKNSTTIRAAARGYDGAGNLISTCAAIDTAADGASVVDNSGCQSAAKYLYHVEY